MKAHIHRYRAPWGTSQCVITAIGCLALVVSATSVLGSGLAAPWNRVWALTIAAAIPLAALFMVQGYEVTDHALRIRRLAWWSVIPLAGLRHAQAGPDLISGSIRLFGNGGFFSSTGWFWNRRLGRYRLFGNNAHLAVALQFDDRIVVIAPEDPMGMVESLRRLTTLAR